jgi:hypothetical protein
MSEQGAVGRQVEVHVSDPWEFGTECGVGPFLAIVVDAEPGALLLRLQSPIEYRGRRFQTILARPRYAPVSAGPLLDSGQLAVNLALLVEEVPLLAAVTLATRAGMVAAIGSVEGSEP